MKRFLYLIIFCAFSTLTQAQHIFQGTSLSEALIELDKSSKHYDISFVYDELEDFTVTKTIKRGRNLPDAVREVCGFYPVRVNVKGRDILVECIQKDRTKLMGRLLGPDRQPVAYANITLFPPSDSVYIGGGVSNEAGDFVIPCGAERARVRISCVGFKTIERVMAIGDVGTIRMQMENNYLSNVTVSGRMPVIRSQADRLQYIVSNDEFARGLNAQELLSRVPMVSMAGGRAVILGKGPARFMLNGHITEMGNEAIQQKLWTLRSDDIDRIEVISIPSGRDMLEMGGGYINIVMRRDQTLGWRGDVSAEAGYGDDWSGRGSASVSYASEKFDMTLDAHAGRTAQTTNQLKEYQTLDDYSYYSDTRTKQTDKELATNLMLRYMPIKNLELGAMLSWKIFEPETTTEGVIRFPTPYWSGSELSPIDNIQTKSLTAYCDWRLDKKGKLLSFTYNNFKKDDNEQTSCWRATIPNNTPKALNIDKNNVDYHIQSGRVDLTLPFSFVTIDAGASYTSIRNQVNSQYDQEFNNPSKESEYLEKAKTAYLSLHHDWNRFSIKAGLRYEHIGLDRELFYDKVVIPTMSTYSSSSSVSISDKVFSRDYWLPSLGFSVKPKDGHQIGLTWGTSTIRPNFYDLNPLAISKTVYDYVSGNPGLLPSRMSNIELSYQNHHGFYASAYHHHTSNVVEQRTHFSIYPQYDSFTFTETENGDRSNQTGFYLRYQYQLTRNILVTFEDEIYYHDYRAWTDDIPNLYGWGHRLVFSVDRYLNRQHTLLLNARYQHWFSDYQGLTETTGYGYFYFALRYSMLADRLKISLVANDPFHQYVTDERIGNGYKYSVSGRYTELVQQSCHTNHHAHYVGLTVSYSFGGKKVRRIHHDTKDTERQRAEKLQK